MASPASAAMQIGSVSKANRDPIGTTWLEMPTKARTAKSAMRDQDDLPSANAAAAITNIAVSRATPRAGCCSAPTGSATSRMYGRQFCGGRESRGWGLPHQRGCEECRDDKDP